MNIAVVEKIANAVLYEGYVLYPYRPSAVKNQLRLTFGVLYPRQYCELQAGAEASEMQTECLVAGGGAATVEVKVRFLQLATRQNWQEGQERDVSMMPGALESIAAFPIRQEFVFAGDEGSAALE